MKEKFKKHKNKLLIILAFISAGGLTQISNFIFDVRDAFSSEVKKPKASLIDEGDFETKIRYAERDFQLKDNLQKAETYK